MFVFENTVNKRLQAKTIYFMNILHVTNQNVFGKVLGIINMNYITHENQRSIVHS